MIIVTILRRSCLSDLVSRPINQSDGPGVPFQNVKTINKTLQERQIFHDISFWVGTICGNFHRASNAILGYNRLTQLITNISGSQ